MEKIRETVRIEPENWQQEPFGRRGAGFWVVAIVGESVIWYNNIEEGFNRSRYAAYGTIDHYFCNQDELDVAVQYLVIALERGKDLVSLVKDSVPLPTGR